MANYMHYEAEVLYIWVDENRTKKRMFTQVQAVNPTMALTSNLTRK